ncbi:MAG: putative protein-tyrosine sulfotransferase [uncultured marine phage]|uniref:Sulfotransferase domain-containing protein n=1 Tax=uncultured marine phage TaxID=707152 RepID=A0A8D9CDK9_9VIRU|nr:MAG: putative protein-tyrosine sulfotransferase [uncultured marine phage]
MKIITDNKEKLTYSIVGLPKSGTSILTRAMNSIEGSTCLSQPIRTMHSINLSNGMKNIHDYEMMQQGTDNFLKGFDKYIKSNSDYKIGGTKEIFVPIKSRVSREVDKIFKNRDFFIFIVRDPKANFARWKELKWSGEKLVKSIGFNADMFCNMYEELFEVFHEMKMYKPCIMVKYEDFCENFSSEWLNSKFKEYLQFEGDLTELKPLVGSGNINCKQSTEILEPNKEYTNLTEVETELIDTRLNNLYKNIRGYGYY